MVTATYWFILLELVSLVTPRPFRSQWTQQVAKLFSQTKRMWSVKQTCCLSECIDSPCWWELLGMQSVPVEKTSSYTWNPDWMLWTLRELQRLVIWGGPHIASDPLKVAFLPVCRNLVLSCNKFHVHYDSQVFGFLPSAFLLMSHK